MDISKVQGTEKINAEGDVEIKVKTVDYRTPPGEDKEPIKENVEITHVTSADEKPESGSVVAEAAGKVAEKLQSAKEAIFDKKTTE